VGDGYFAAKEIIHLRFLECVFVVPAVGLPVFTTVTLPQASAMGAVSPYSHLQEEEPVIQ